jgi:hypothetical protein
MPAWIYFQTIGIKRNKVYLARIPMGRKVHYYIRQSFCEHGALKSRDLFYLGTDPARYIIYPGGHGYYYDACVIEALMQAGAPADQNDLDDIFFEFIDPEIQRVIEAFDRGRHRHTLRLNDCAQGAGNLHAFDKKRYHFLRFGNSGRGPVDNLADRYFRPLLQKSRDELEQYFIKEEHVLRHHEKAVYVSTLFDMRQFRPDPEKDQAITEQMDHYFIRKLCRLNADIDFWADRAIGHGRLNDYFIKYAIMYFDFEPPRQAPWQSRFEEFMNQHRTYRPPRNVRIKIEEAANMFGKPWKELKALDRRGLSRLYRTLSMQYHPDRGGSPELFRKLNQYYQALLQRKPKQE